MNFSVIIAFRYRSNCYRSDRDEPVETTRYAGRARLATPLNSKSLFQGRKTLTIEHNGEHYTLRITANGKLILTK